MKGPWTVHTLTGELVSPAHAWLIDRLAKLNRDRPGLVAYHAAQVYGHWLTLRWRNDNKRYAIGGRWARPKLVGTTRGAANELAQILRLAKGRSDKRWRTGYLNMSGRTRSLIFRGPIKRTNDLQAISPRGLYMLAPSRTAAVPRIEAALRKLKAIPAATRRRRAQDSLGKDFADAVRLAHRVLTDDVDVHHGSGLARLVSDINAHFDCKLKI